MEGYTRLCINARIGNALNSACGWNRVIEPGRVQGIMVGSWPDGYRGLSGRVARTWADWPVADISIQAVPGFSGGMILSHAAIMRVSAHRLAPPLAHGLTTSCRRVVCQRPSLSRIPQRWQGPDPVGPAGLERDAGG
jgi:hypothetical protein